MRCWARGARRRAGHQTRQRPGTWQASKGTAHGLKSGKPGSNFDYNPRTGSGSRHGAASSSAKGQWIVGGILAAFAGMSVEEFEARSEAFMKAGVHPTLQRGYLDCAYLPMVELLGYLSSNGFTNYIASGGGRDFMRPISLDIGPRSSS